MLQIKICSKIIKFSPHFLELSYFLINDWETNHNKSLQNCIFRTEEMSQFDIGECHFTLEPSLNNYPILLIAGVGLYFSSTAEKLWTFPANNQYIPNLSGIFSSKLLKLRYQIAENQVILTKNCVNIWKSPNLVSGYFINFLVSFRSHMQSFRTLGNFWKSAPLFP